MKGAPTSTAGSSEQPFIWKTYDMINDSTTDEIVSWSSSNDSFIVWNPSEFSRLVLPKYFKHNNFSSFIRQLNTYGFRKVDPGQWEFANKDFVKDQKHILKKIHRKKPVRSHNHPPGALVDSERAAYEEEIKKLSCANTSLESDIRRFKQRELAAKLQMDDVLQRLDAMEKRQNILSNFFEKALENPTFVEQLSKKIDFANIFDDDFTNQLRLEMELALGVADMNMVSCSTQGSNGDKSCPLKNHSEGKPKELHPWTTLPFSPETLELADAGPSLTFNMDSSLPRSTITESPKLHSLKLREEGDSDEFGLLNFTFASSPLHFNENSYLNYSPQMDYQEIGKLIESEGGVTSKRNLADEFAKISSPEDPGNSQAAPAGVNDPLWEQLFSE